MEEKYPQLIDRIQSTCIDGLLIIISMFAFSTILEKFEHPPDWIRIVLFFGIWIVYEPLCTTLGCTLGHYIKGIRVRSVNNTSKKINIFKALLRYVLKVLLGWVSFLTIHTNPKRQAIHNLFAESVMIKLH